MSHWTGALTSGPANDEQYDSEDRLQRRISIWQPADDGRDPVTIAVGLAVEELRSGGRMLEVGCGTGTYAARVAASGAEVVATDRSARMVELTGARGVPAQVASADDLPFPEGSFDVVAANWMLYHVPDLEAALAELRRVLRPGGLLIAVTNGDQHLADLLGEAGESELRTQFSSENGEEALLRHFDTVTRDDLQTWAAFPDHAAAAAYLRTVSDRLGDSLPEFDGPRRYAGATTVFTAR